MKRGFTGVFEQTPWDQMLTDQERQIQDDQWNYSLSFKVPKIKNITLLDNPNVVLKFRFTNGSISYPCCYNECESIQIIIEHLKMTWKLTDNLGLYYNKCKLNGSLKSNNIANKTLLILQNV